MVTLSDAINKHAKALARFMSRDFPEIVAQEGLNHFNSSFKNQGFTDTSKKGWQQRKTTDTRGRDITRYRKRGGLNQYGRRTKGRAILTGHNTAGNKLKNSLRADSNPNRVKFYTYKKYAKYHNEGAKSLPKRQFMGESKALDNKINRKTERELDKIFKYNGE